MVSTYGYATLANLEKYAVKDYSAIDTALTDTIVDEMITNAEKFINGYIGTTFTGTIPDSIELVTKMIAKILIDNYMIEEKIGTYAQYDGVITNILERYDIILILEQYKDIYSPKQGIFFSKHTHVSPASYREMRRPTGW